MTSRDLRSPGRALLILVAASALGACGSTKPASFSSAPAPQPVAKASPSETHRHWEADTRRLADRLLEEADLLAAAGHSDEAMDRLDDALCEVLTPPEGYRTTPSYLEYISLLLDQADAVEAKLELEPADEDDGELVEPPPVDVEEQQQVAEVEHEGGILPESDLPLELNPTVRGFLDTLTSPGEYRSRIATGLERAGLYLPMIRARLSSAGMPEDLAYLPLIESAFSIKAYSRAHAHGMWQFIAPTARLYGLDVGSLVDERRDPIRSTEAAIAYLADLYGEFSDWELALAAYNSGAGNVRRAIRRAHSTDFWALRRYLPRETRNYVPAFIASVIIAKQPERFGFPVPDEQDWLFEEVTVPDALDLQFLASKADLPLTVLRDLNPALRRDLTPANHETTLRLPPGTSDRVHAVLASVPRSDWAPRLLHTVHRGDSLYTIARRYGSSVSAIRQANNLRGSLIRPGQTLLVPRFGGAAYSPAPSARTTVGGAYVVKRRDTLWDIARSFSLTVDALCAANGLSRWDTIHPGQRLVVPGAAATAVASKESATQAGDQQYRVRKGDTLYDIARKFGTSVHALRQANGLRSSRIYPGDVLHIPLSRATS